MREIAKVVKTVLSSTTPATTAAGAPSPAKFVLADSVKTAAQARVTDLLKSFPLYPELGEI
jgi:glycine hydroxymethyltransferase